MSIKPVVIKITGHVIEDPAVLDEFAAIVRNMAGPVVIVHGGGKEITDLQTKLGIEPHYIDGVRITDEASLAVVEMVLCGTVNKRVVRHLLAAGIDALGMSGMDLGLIRAQKMPHPEIDMGFTGEIVSVKGDILIKLLEQGITPVLAPTSLGDHGALNVNADHVTGAVAAAIHAERAIFLTNVAGVQGRDGIIPRLDANGAAQLIADGVIFGGMIPKVQMALHTLKRGVPEAVITNLAGLQQGSGTIFSLSSANIIHE
ncbi:MAG: acetylglutamate kinase [Chloroflexi bacterium]|nr:MAG: acetylglutamate kinase [Phototrophicales bacterium]RMF80364.1 MAG: acetylglutamate kinase [Chloroflexota bacterium]